MLIYRQFLLPLPVVLLQGLQFLRSVPHAPNGNKPLSDCCDKKIAFWPSVIRFGGISLELR
jgi:hypothetical protein